MNSNDTSSNRYLHPNYAQRAQSAAASEFPQQEANPVPMQLWCPNCGLPHIDALDKDTGIDWAKRPHKTHLCLGCRQQWRPFEYATAGVQASGAHPLLEPVASHLRALTEELATALQLRDGALDAQAEAEKKFFAARDELTEWKAEAELRQSRIEELHARVAELEAAEELARTRGQNNRVLEADNEDQIDRRRAAESRLAEATALLADVRDIVFDTDFSPSHGKSSRIERLERLLRLPSATPAQAAEPEREQREGTVHRSNALAHVRRLENENIELHAALEKLRTKNEKALNILLAATTGKRVGLAVEALQ